MGGEEPVAIPNDPYTDVGELGIDNIGVMPRRGNERFHHRGDVRAGTHVLAEFGPVVGDPSADGARMADEVARPARAISHLGRPAAGERRQLPIDAQRRKPHARAGCVDLGDEVSFVRRCRTHGTRRE